MKPKKTKYYCFLCSSEVYSSILNSRIKTPMGIILRDPSTQYSENDVDEFRDSVVYFFSNQIFKHVRCVSYEEYKKKLKKQRKRPKCKSGNCLCDNCFSLYSVVLFLETSENDNIILKESSLKLFISGLGFKDDISVKKFTFTPEKGTSNRLFHNSIDIQAMKLKSEKEKARRQFNKISIILKDFLSFISNSFEGYPLTFYFAADFPSEVSIGQKSPLCKEFTLSAEGIIKEVELGSNDKIKELDICYVYDLWSLLTYVKFLAVRKILSPVVKICNISKFYEKKLINDQRILEKGIVKCIKIGKVNGLIIELREILRSIVYNTEKIIEMSEICDRKIENVKQNNQNLFFKFKGRREIDFKEKNFTFRGKNYGAIVLCNFPLGVGPDETPHSKDLKRNKHTAMINILSLIDSSHPQSLQNSLLLFLLSYKGKLIRGDYLKIFGDSKWSEELKSVEKLCFVREIDTHIADRICNNFFYAKSILLCVRFHFHFLEDEAQYSMDQGESKEKPPIIQTRVDIDTKKGDRKSHFYENPSEKLGKNLRIKKVSDMDLNLKFIKFLEGKRKVLPKSLTKSVYKGNHFYRGLDSSRSHIDHVVHSPKRIGSFELCLLIFLFRFIILCNIKDLKLRQFCRMKFLTFLVDFGIVDRSMVLNKDKELDWVKFIQKIDSVLNITGDKRKILIGITKFSENSKKFYGSFIVNLKECCEEIIKTGKIDDVYSDCFMSWIGEFIAYFEGEISLHGFYSSTICNTVLTIKRGAKLTDKAGIFHQIGATVCKRLPRYCAYRFDWKSTGSDVFENGDTGSFGCSGKELCMSVFRELWERSPKFRDLAVRKLQFQMWNSLNGSNDIEWVENDVHLNTLFSILCHWMMRTSILRELYLNHEKVSSVLDFSVDVLKLQFPFNDFNEFFLENVDSKVSNEIPLVNTSVSVENDPIEELNYLQIYQQNLLKLKRRTLALIKETKSRLNRVTLDWESFTPVIRGLLKTKQGYQIKNWLNVVKIFEENGNLQNTNYFIKNNNFEFTRLGLCLFWFMGKGKTFIFLLIAMSWINYMKEKYKFDRPRATVLIVVPKALSGQMMSDIEECILKFKLKSVFFFNISDVGSIKKILFIISSVKRKGGIIVGHSEKFIKLAKLCGIVDKEIETEDDDECIQMDSNIFIDPEGISEIKSLLFESGNTFVIIDEVSSVFQKNYKILEKLFSSHKRVLVSTGTPIEKYGKILNYILDFVFQKFFSETHRHNLKSLSDILEDSSGRDFGDIGELCYSIHRMLYEDFKGFISIDMNSIPRRKEYLIFFEPSEKADDILEDLESGLLSRKVEHNYISISDDFYDFIEEKREKNKKYYVKLKHLDSFFNKKFGDLTRKRNEKDILKLKSGVSFFTWKFTKHSKSFNKKIVIASDYVNNLILFSRIFAESKFKDIKNVKPFSGNIRSSKKKDELVKRFVDSNEFEIFLLSIGSGGYGLNLQRKCSDMIIIALPWNYTKYIQLITRLDRPGQEEDKVNIKIPMLIDTSEEEIHLKVIQKLIIKKGILEAIFNGKSPKFDFGLFDLNNSIIQNNLIYSPEEIDDEYIQRYIDKINLDTEKPSWMKIKYCVCFSDLTNFFILNEKTNKRKRQNSTNLKFNQKKPCHRKK